MSAIGKKVNMVQKLINFCKSEKLSVDAHAESKETHFSFDNKTSELSLTLHEWLLKGRDIKSNDIWRGLQSAL